MLRPCETQKRRTKKKTKLILNRYLSFKKIKKVSFEKYFIEMKDEV